MKDVREYKSLVKWVLDSGNFNTIRGGLFTRIFHWRLLFAEAYALQVYPEIKDIEEIEHWTELESDGGDWADKHLFEVKWFWKAYMLRNRIMFRCRKFYYKYIHRLLRLLRKADESIF